MMYDRMKMIYIMKEPVIVTLSQKCNDLLDLKLYNDLDYTRNIEILFKTFKNILINEYNDSEDYIKFIINKKDYENNLDDYNFYDTLFLLSYNKEKNTFKFIELTNKDYTELRTNNPHDYCDRTYHSEGFLKVGVQPKFMLICNKNGWDKRKLRVAEKFAEKHNLTILYINNYNNYMLYDTDEVRYADDYEDVIYDEVYDYYLNYYALLDYSLYNRICRCKFQYLHLQILVFAFANHCFWRFHPFLMLQLPLFRSF